MKAILITIRLRGMPARRHVGIYPSTAEAVLAAIDMAGDQGGPVSISAQVHGRIEQRQCAPGLCQGLHTCRDHHCEGHPANEVRPQERDGPLTARVLVGYFATLAVCGFAAWQWLTR